ncbi:hypothetical protein MCG98_06770 [Ruminococcus sp. OA3]|uniref:hypothetical protein n=1 Tax=Ruminococcus sp. OA3 TaxID=2914164 RepID=UPI001F059F5B|nr:hypothetical protein [Ruminococcus sp. OA3]MCH1982266.1 hypothetical protein [Ruminococcus sp. OA3]
MVSGAAFGFVINLLYALYNGALGIVYRSVWFITMCAYYMILSTTRFSAVLCERQNNKGASNDMEYFVMKLSGGLLAALSLVLTSVIYISLAENIATKHETIVMIMIATYTFYKITIVSVRAVKHHKNPSPLLTVIRSIGYADVSASIFTLQRSMFISFGELTDRKAFIMDVLTGAAVCLFILALGLSMIIKGKKKGK